MASLLQHRDNGNPHTVDKLNGRCSGCFILGSCWLVEVFFFMKLPG